MMDEIAKFARSKTGRSGLIGESDKFWFDFARAEARVLAARAFHFEVWRNIEASIEAGNRVSTRQIASFTSPSRKSMKPASTLASSPRERPAVPRSAPP